MPRWIVISGVLLAVGAGAVVFAVRAHKPKPAPVVSAPPPAPAEVSLTGLVQARTMAPAGAPIAGVIDAFFLDANQPVYKDQLLGRIRDPQADAAVSQAQTALDQAQRQVATLGAEQLQAKLEVSRAEADQSRARADLDRLEKNYQKQKGLWDLGATPRLTFEKSEQDYHDAQKAAENLDAGAKAAHEHVDRVAADIEAANKAAADATAALDKAKSAGNSGEIHSPADGIVAARHGQPGEMVEQNANVFDIATDLTQLQATVPAAPQMRAGEAAAIRVPELSPDEIAGVVREIRGDLAIIDFTSPVAAVRLDLTAQVKIKF